MNLSFSIAGLILFVFAAPRAQAQAHVLPLNLDPGFGSPQSASSIGGSFDSSVNTTRSPSALNTPSAPATGPTVPRASIQNDKPICGITHLGRCIQDLGEDERGIFTSPLRLQPKDVYWLAPLGAATGFAFAYDTDAVRAAGVNASRTDTANRVANFGSFFAAGAEGAGIYFIGLAQKNSKLSETGRLGAEAVIDSGSLTLLTKLVSNRQRPLQGNRQGRFWAYGTNHWEWDSSFPSDHATASMALARVIAGEYPRWYVMIPAYGFVGAVSISRIMANQHFPSDVLAGQAIGFLTGSYVLNHRALHRPNAKRTFVSKLIGSIDPLVDLQTHSLGASMEIPLER